MYILFSVGEKRFAIPSAFEAGFLSKPDSVEEGGTSVSKETAEAGARSPDNLIRELAAKGFKCLDNRSTSGIVWVLYRADMEATFKTIAAAYNVQYRFERRGALATKNEPAWRIMLT